MHDLLPCPDLCTKADVNYAVAAPGYEHGATALSLTLSVAADLWQPPLRGLAEWLRLGGGPVGWIRSPRSSGISTRTCTFPCIVLPLPEAATAAAYKAASGALAEIVGRPQSDVLNELYRCSDIARRFCIRLLRAQVDTHL